MMKKLKKTRQKIEKSKLQNPEDVEGLIEMRVNNDDIDKDFLDINRKSIDVETDASNFAERLTYPCATAEYTTGANEDTRRNASLFIFTDIYCFEVSVSIAADAYEEYQTDSLEWFESVQLVEGKAMSAGEKKKPVNGSEKAADSEEIIEKHQADK